MTDMADADELVRRLILRRWQNGDGLPSWKGRPSEHLRSCAEITLADVEASNGSYGCDTGCEYARFEATITCAHGESYEFEWGDFGMIDDFIEDMSEDEEATR